LRIFSCISFRSTAFFGRCFWENSPGWGSSSAFPLSATAPIVLGVHLGPFSHPPGQLLEKSAPRYGHFGSWLDSSPPPPQGQHFFVCSGIFLLLPQGLESLSHSPRTLQPFPSYLRPLPAFFRFLPFFFSFFIPRASVPFLPLSFCTASRPPFARPLLSSGSSPPTFFFHDFQEGLPFFSLLVGPLIFLILLFGCVFSHPLNSSQSLSFFFFPPTLFGKTGCQGFFSS